MRKIGLYSGSALLCLLLIFSALTPVLAMEAKFSGQVNQMVMYANDGENSDFFVTDNDNSSTRLRFDASQVYGLVKAGVRVEIEAQRNPSNDVTINQNSDDGFTWNDRWLNAFFATPAGTIEIGKGDSAANTTAEVDLSGTSVVTYSLTNATGGAIEWNSDANSGPYTTPIAIDDTRDNFDGPLSRTDRLRYNTPTFAGFTLSGAVENGGAWDTSVFYSAELYGKLAAAVGYTKLERRSTTYDSVVDGSISWLAPFGLNATVSLGKGFRPDGIAQKDPVSYYAKLGYKFGINAVSIEYGQTKDLAANGDKSSNYGAAYVIHPWKPVELYVAYRVYMLDREAVNGGDAENINLAMAGTRIKF
jgi:hypothetical protein